MIRHLSRYAAKGVASAFLLMICALVLGVGADVWAAKGNLIPVDMENLHAETKPLKITLGKAEVIELDGEVSDVLVADPSIVDVQAIQSNRLYAVGVGIGDTNIITLNAQGDVIKRIDVHVSFDLRAIQGLVGDLFPEEDVQIGSIHGQILLTGSVSTPEKASKIANIVGHYVSELTESEDPIDELLSNLMEVRGEQQVMLQVRIVEATRSVLKEFGLETQFNDPNELSTTTLFGNNPGLSQLGSSNGLEDPAQFAVETGAGIALSEDPAATASLIFNSGIAGIGIIGAFLNALEEQNLVNVLAEPNLTAVSGEQAGFLAGGEFPVPVGRDQFGNITVEFREFGVSLNFRPTVMSDKRISLQLDTEVSSLDFESAVVLADVTVPGLDIRRASTTVEVPSGGSLMIAGLLKSEAIEGMSGLPGISKAPVLGDLVSSDSFQRDETEMIVIITPYLVEPYADKTRAEKVPVERERPLSTVFASNVRRNYDVEDDEIFVENQFYGYLLD